MRADKPGWGSRADLPPLLPSVSGPCDHEDLCDGVIFGAKYLGSTQLVSERNPPPSTRMAQAQEAMDRVKVKPGAGRRVGGQAGYRPGPPRPCWVSGCLYLPPHPHRPLMGRPSP